MENIESLHVSFMDEPVIDETDISMNVSYNENTDENNNGIQNTAPENTSVALATLMEQIEAAHELQVDMVETTPKLHGAVAMYGPCAVRDLKEGETKYWCRCGLSKKQPWCDGSHKGTDIKPLKWIVDKSQELFYICACKQTRNPPYCDGHHVDAPAEVENRKKNCTRKDGHNIEKCKLCTNCGWVPDF